jgi:hypothetical protein
MAISFRVNGPAPATLLTESVAQALLRSDDTMGFRLTQSLSPLELAALNAKIEMMGKIVRSRRCAIKFLVFEWQLRPALRYQIIDNLIFHPISRVLDASPDVRLFRDARETFKRRIVTIWLSFLFRTISSNVSGIL